MVGYNIMWKRIEPVAAVIATILFTFGIVYSFIMGAPL